MKFREGIDYAPQEPPAGVGFSAFDFRPGGKVNPDLPGQLGIGKPLQGLQSFDIFDEVV